MKFTLLAATVFSLLQLSAALYVPTDPETLAKLSIDKATPPADTDYYAPFVTSEHARQNVIEDAYIIIFNDDVEPRSRELSSHFMWLEEHHNSAMSSLSKRDSQHPFLSSNFPHGIRHIFEVANGYSGRFLPETIEAIRKDKRVKFVEHDSLVFATDFEVQKDSTWGLARISHRKRLSLGSFNEYLYDDEGGEGVTAYVIDTGTNIEHVDFEGRASWGKTIPAGDQDVDGNGHGTHCSGTIAGKKYGVAKKAHVVAVKVLRSNGSGTMSDVLKGVEWAVGDHQSQVKKNKKGFKGSTANMSLGGGKSPSLDLTVNAAVKAGLHFAVAAGNDNADACNYSPAGAKDAVTVGASSIYDNRAYFSNYGKCVDVFGPGVDIVSTYIGSKYAVASLSGTSMASPHVCGLLSYFLSLQPSSDSEFAVAGTVTPAQLKKNILKFSTPDSIDDVPSDTPNLLIFNGAGKNLTEFWNSAIAEDVKETEFNILPISEQKIEHDLEMVKKEMLNLLDAFKNRIGHF